jgi:uncharacterized membrane-anchored protein
LRTGSAIPVAILLAIFSVRYLSEKSLSVARITTPKAELFHRFAILFSGNGI